MVKILSIGAAVQDVFLSHSEEFKAVCLNPEECFMQLTLGSKADVNKIDFTTGGGATNAAVTFARQGLEAEFMAQSATTQRLLRCLPTLIRRASIRRVYTPRSATILVTLCYCLHQMASVRC